MFWFGTCEVHGDLCPLCLTTQVSIIYAAAELAAAAKSAEFRIASAAFGVLNAKPFLLWSF